MQIKEISAKKIFDSRGEETIEVIIDGCRASSPSGKSTGKYETKPYAESLDSSIDSINSLKFNFPISSFNDLKKVENYLCKKYGYRNARQFGANALFALESAILKALAKSNKLELWQVINPKAVHLPIPVGNAIGGGLHSSKFKVHPLFQEFLIIPNESSFKKNFMMLKEVYAKIGLALNANSKNDEGAWQAPIGNKDALDTLAKFKNIRIGIDVAASSFFRGENYIYKTKALQRDSQIKYLNFLIDKYNLLYLEDPLQEEDFMGFSRLTKKHLIVGDDLTATQLGRLKEAIKNSSINAMIVKPNQNGSLLELKKIVELCKANNIKTILSHRSGETMDTSLADYAFGFQTDYIKCGISTVWREAKLKRLLEIEESFNLN